MTWRLLVVLALVGLLVAGRWAYARWRRSLVDERRPVPRLPAELLGGGERTWVVFSTPFCASCGPVTEELRNRDPGADVVRVDATERVDLAEAFHVRAAPTVLLADRAGTVAERLVGASAVRERLALAPSDAA